MRLSAALMLAAIGFAAPAADVEYTYDENGRLVGVYAPSGDAAQYVYDAAGNITQIKRLPGGVLALMDFSPKTGPVGTQVTIWGNGFSTTPSQNAVSFNGTAATVASAAANKLIVTVPVGATTGTIAITVSAATATSTASFVVNTTISCASRVTGFSPAIGVVGASVAISGVGFDTGLNFVQFNGASAAVQSATSTTLTVTVPAGATSGRLVVSLPPSCAPINAGDFFVPPPLIAASSIGATGRLTINGASATATLAAAKKALYMFDAAPGLGAGVYLSASTLSSVTADIRAPDGAIVSTVSFVTSTSTIPPVYFRVTGGHSIYVNPISGTAGSITLQLGAPDLAVTSASLNGTVTGNQNGSFNIPVSFTVANSGAITAQPNWYDFIFLSNGLTLEPTSVVVGSALRTTTLSPASNYTVSQTYTLSGVTPGSRTLFVRADSHGGSGTADLSGYMVESNENNNLSAAVAVVLPPYPDLAISNASVGTITENQNGSFNIPVSFKVTNIGVTTALPSWIDYGYLSSNGLLDASSIALTGVLRSTSLAGAANYTLNPTYLTTGISPGSYTLFLKADGHAGALAGDNGVVAETSEANNVASFSIVLPTYPDLAISNPVVGTITANGSNYNIPVTYTVTNVGATASQPNWLDYGYLSRNGVLDASSTPLGLTFRGAALAASGSYNVTQTYVTSGFTAGTYTLFLKTDGQGTGAIMSNGFVVEASESNNVTTGISVTLP